MYPDNLTADEKSYAEKVERELNSLIINNISISHADKEDLQRKISEGIFELIVIARQNGRSPFEMECERTEAEN